MAYVPDPTDPTRPTLNDLAGDMAFEFQALKGYIQSLIVGGSNFTSFGGFRNRLNNGDFRIAQRGLVNVATGTTVYTLDQWVVNATGTNIAASRQTAAGTAGLTNGTRLINLAGNANTVMNLYNRMEAQNCADLVSGSVVTVSGLYFTSVLPSTLPNIILVTPNAVDNWGVGNTIVGASTSMSIVPQIAATFQFFSQSFVLAGDATNGLALQFNWPGGIASTTVAFANVQLEKGALASPFEIRPMQSQFAGCQRYYQIGSFQISAYEAAAAQFGVSQPLRVTMRVTPTLASAFSTTTNCGTATLTALGTDLIFPAAVATALGATVLAGTYTASAEL